MVAIAMQMYNIFPSNFLFNIYMFLSTTGKLNDGVYIFHKQWCKILLLMEVVFFGKNNMTSWFDIAFSIWHKSMHASFF